MSKVQVSVLEKRTCVICFESVCATLKRSYLTDKLVRLNYNLHVYPLQWAMACFNLGL